MSAVSPLPDRTEEPNDPLDEKQKGPAQASTQRRIAGRLLQTLRAQTLLAAQGLQQAATRSSRESAAAKTAIQSASTLFNERSSSTDEALMSFERDLQSTAPGQFTMSHITSSFARLSLSETPEQKIAQDPLWGFKRDRMAQNMATAQIGAFVAHAVGTVVKVTAKGALGCYSFDSRVRQVCQSNIHFVKKTGIAALEAIGLMKVFRAIATPPPALLQELQRQYLIPQDEAVQYYLNSLTTGVSLIPMPPVMKWGRMAYGKVSQSLNPKEPIRMAPEPPKVFDAEWCEGVERPKLPAPVKSVESASTARSLQRKPDVKAHVRLDKNVLKVKLVSLRGNLFKVMASFAELARQKNANVLQIRGEFINPRFYDLFVRRYGEPVKRTPKDIKDLPQDAGVYGNGIRATFEIPILKPPNAPAHPAWHETELALYEELAPQVRVIESLPIGLPQDLRTFHSQCQFLSFPLTPNGTKLLGHVPYVKNLDRALFVIERATDSPRVAKMVGSDILIQSSQGAYHFVDRIVDQVIEGLEKMGVKEAYIVFDKERMPVITALSKRSEVEVVGAGTFYTGAFAGVTKNMTLLHIKLKAEAKTVAAAPFRYPEMVVRDVDRAVSGKKSLHLYDAIYDSEAELLLPLFVNEKGREQLYLEVISKYHTPLTREAKIEYFTDEHERYVAKVSDRGHSLVVHDRTSGSEIVQRLKGLYFLRSKNLLSIGMPIPIACFRYVEDGVERYVLITTFVNDLTIEEGFQGIGYLEPGSDVRKAELARLSTSSNFLGKGTAELQTIDTKPNKLDRRIDSDIGALEDLINEVSDNLVDIGMRDAVNFESCQAAFYRIKTDYRNAPGHLSFGFGGDIAASKFVYTNASKPFVSLIDADFVTKHVSVSGQPLEPVCKHYYNILHMFTRDGLANGLTLQEVMSLQLSYATGYSSISKEIFPTAASRFYDIYYSLDAIRDLAEDIASGKPISKELLGTLLGELKEKLK